MGGGGWRAALPWLEAGWGGVTQPLGRVERERQTDRQTDRQRQTEREGDREREAILRQDGGSDSALGRVERWAGSGGGGGGCYLWAGWWA